MYIISHHYVVLSELFCLYFLIIIKKQKKHVFTEIQKLLFLTIF